MKEERMKENRNQDREEEKILKERGETAESRDEVLKRRKDMLSALVRDPAYVPMKAKEIAALLNIPREQREELEQVLEAMVAERKAGDLFRYRHVFRPSKGLWFCDCGGNGSGCIYSGGKDCRSHAR